MLVFSRPFVGDQHFDVYIYVAFLFQLSAAVDSSNETSNGGHEDETEREVKEREGEAS